MTVTAHDMDSERQALVATFRELGPDAPTLCEGWTTRELSAHLVTREHRADVLPGILAGGTPLGRHTEKVLQDYSGKDWGTLLAILQRGPARYLPFSWPKVGPRMNVAEFVVHHEDARRGGGDLTPRQDPELQKLVWQVLPTIAKVAYRSSPVGVVLQAPGYGRSAARRPRPARGSVVLTGEPVELLLHAFGRQQVADVELAGDRHDVEALSGTDRSF